MSKKTKTDAALFIFALLLWLATISHNTLGFVVPDNAQAIGFDFVPCLLWWLFTYASLRLYRTFRSPNARPRSDAGSQLNAGS